MRRLTAVLLAIAFVYGVSQDSKAALIMDTLEDIGPDGTVINIRIIDGVTVTISPNTGTMKAHTYGGSLFAFEGVGAVSNNIPLTPANVSGERFISTLTSVNNSAESPYFSAAVPIVFTFSSAIKEFQLTTLDVLESTQLSTVFVKLEAFDALNSSVDSDVWFWHAGFEWPRP
jgi:hypothetical protein